MGIIRLAFGLGHQELRGDEAFDALFAAQPVSVILGQLQIEQPYPPLFHVWHAQDGRMLSLLDILSVATIWLGLCLLQDRSATRTGLAYWAVTVLALLTHHFAWWVLLAENVAAAPRS